MYVSENSFIVRGCEIVPIFDYVHLLKGTRNNLLAKDLDVDCKNIHKYKEEKYASWDHIVLSYNIDKYSFMKQRQMPKLTDRHIIQNLIPKMKVKHASQVFNKTVSNFIDVVLNLSGGKKIYKKLEINPNIYIHIYSIKIISY